MIDHLSSTMDDYDLEVPELMPAPVPNPIPYQKSTIIGIYGIPGAGKTFLLNELERDLEGHKFVFYEGSEVINEIVEGGLEAFHQLPEYKKSYYRRLAIQKIRTNCQGKSNTAIVTGHYMFWAEEESEGNEVLTAEDLNTFSHIIYLDTPPETIEHRCHTDTRRDRPAISLSHTKRWQHLEKTNLRDLCYSHDILFIELMPSPKLLTTVSMLVRDFHIHCIQHNAENVEAELGVARGPYSTSHSTMLVLDADQTLAAEDTGHLFWQTVAQLEQYRSDGNPLKRVFSSSMGYSYTAFRQAMLLYEEVAYRHDIDAICMAVARMVTVRPEFISLLRSFTEDGMYRTFVVTCGLRRIWELILQREGLSDMVTLIGGGQVKDTLVVTPDNKATLVTYLQERYRAYVWAFGDSVLDLDMLQAADEPIIVVGSEGSRSGTMDDLMDAVRVGRLRARQALIPSSTRPLLDIRALPIFNMIGHYTPYIVRPASSRACNVTHATKRTAAKLLMTTMRDARVIGPALRTAHEDVGKYLALEFLGNVIGLEDYPTPHVQGHEATGYRLFHEHQTLIVALMRGGEPMAFGVSRALPLATFLHANEPRDIKPKHLEGCLTVILVDSVVNSGNTMMQYIEHIDRSHATIAIVVLAGVVQTEAIPAINLAFERISERQRRFDLVALRLSENKYTGKGTTDTGNRLFGTTSLD